MNYVGLIIFLVVVVGLLAFSARARRRQATVLAERTARIGVGTEVMTTSGLYGTVVALVDDDKVMMSIAPGVEVKWALAALRDMQSLPSEYRDEPVGSTAEPAEAADVPAERRTDADPAA